MSYTDRQEMGSGGTDEWVRAPIRRVPKKRVGGSSENKDVNSDRLRRTDRGT